MVVLSHIIEFILIIKQDLCC